VNRKQQSNDSTIITSNNANESIVSPKFSNSVNNHLHEVKLNKNFIAIGNEDTLAKSNSIEHRLFKVPYRCTLNRDSLRAESRKVILEFDTIPKGLHLIYNNNTTDSTINSKISNFSKSIFSSHLLSTKKISPKPIIYENNNWMTIILILILFLIGVLRVFYQKKFNLFVNAFISKRFSNQISREENGLTQSTSVLLTIIFFLSISFFLYLSGRYYHQFQNGKNEFEQFLMILIGCLGFYFFKLIANKLTGYIFKIYRETDEYIFNHFLVLQIIGILLTAWCILLNYSTFVNKEFIIYVGFGTLFISFCVRMVKSLGIANMSSYSPIYIFLYLCSLEILPLIIIVKLIIR